MSHPNSQAYPRERLIATRRAELAEAARILNLDHGKLIELGFLDAAAPRGGPDFDKAVKVIGDLVTRSDARSLFVTWAHDPHCDHEAAALFAEELRRRHPSLKLWSYPVWGWHLPAETRVARTPASRSSTGRRRRPGPKACRHRSSCVPDDDID